MFQNKIPENEYGSFNGRCVGNIRTCLIPLYLDIVHLYMAINYEYYSFNQKNKK